MDALAALRGETKSVRCYTIAPSFINYVYKSETLKISTTKNDESDTEGSIDYMRKAWFRYNNSVSSISHFLYESVHFGLLCVIRTQIDSIELLSINRNKWIMPQQLEATPISIVHMWKRYDFMQVLLMLVLCCFDSQPTRQHINDCFQPSKS